MKKDVYAVGDEFDPDWARGRVLSVREGGFGRVYVVGSGPYADIASLSAYKTLIRSSKTEWDSFYDEAQIWFKVRGCPFVLRPIQVVRHSLTRRPFIRMPYAKESLRDLLAAYPSGIGIKPSLCVLIKCLEGLKCAAQRGLHAHLDFKPENIFIARESVESAYQLLNLTPLVADFGLSRMSGAPHSGTRGFSRIYAPPAQYDSQAGQPGPWSDNYSLAVLLFELTTGVLPNGYRFETLPEPLYETIVGKLWSQTGKRKDIREYLPTASSELARLLERCMSPSSVDRPQTFTEFQEILYQVLAGCTSLSWSTEFRSRIVEFDARTAMDFGVDVAMESPEAVIRRLGELEKIRPREAEAEATVLLDKARGPGSDVLAAARQRLGALAAVFLARRRQMSGETESASRLADEAAKILILLANLGAECAGEPVPMHIADRTAYTLAGDLLRALRAKRANADADAASLEVGVNGVLGMSARMAPYLCDALGAAFHGEGDWACAFFWKLKAIKLKDDDAEFHYILGSWAEAAEKLPQSAVWEGLAGPCRHGRVVPWSSAGERYAFMRARYERAAALSPDTFGRLT